jgi:hypothetical protein
MEERHRKSSDVIDRNFFSGISLDVSQKPQRRKIISHFYDGSWFIAQPSPPFFENNHSPTARRSKFTQKVPYRATVSKKALNDDPL